MLIGLLSLLGAFTVAAWTLWHHNRREIRSFNRTMITEHVVAVITAVDGQLEAISSGRLRGAQDRIPDAEFVTFYFGLLPHKAAISLVSPTCDQVLVDRFKALVNARNDAAPRGVETETVRIELMRLRSRLILAHGEAVAHPHRDEKEMKVQRHLRREEIDQYEAASGLPTE